MIRKHSLLGLIILFTSILLCCFLYFVKRNNFILHLDSDIPDDVIPHVQSLIDGLNKSRILTDKKFTFYLVNFTDKSESIKPIKDGSHSILWLGSKNGYINLEDIRLFDYIFASSSTLVDFLRKSGVNAHLLPLSSFDNNNFEIDYNKNSLIGIIGDFDLVNDVLSKKGIVSKKYNIKDTKKILDDMMKFRAVFIKDTELEKKSLDMHPIVYKLAYNKIPLITLWSWPKKDDNIILFNDGVNFYINKEDLNILVDEILNNSVDIKKRVEFSYNLVNKEFNLDVAIKRIKSVLIENKDYVSKSEENSINFDLGVSAGHIGSGDFWLAKDIGYGLTKKGYLPSLTFFNSFYKYKTDINILIRGFIPIASRDLSGKHNILYIAYPQFGQKDGIELVENVDDYINNHIRNDKNNFDAIITASSVLADKLKTLGYNAFYVPQFTNTDRFYPDFHSNIQGDILFVGVNAFYRKAWKYLYDEGFHATIYGPNYPKNISKGEYLDNRDLRKYYSSYKIILNDTRDGMKEYGVISNRIFDATSCGGLVISDYMKEIEDVYGDSIPMWKSKEELIELVKYYLDPKNENERIEKANRAREITLQHFTNEKISNQLDKIIKSIKNK